jgi:hypothetical protein
MTYVIVRDYGYGQEETVIDRVQAENSYDAMAHYRETSFHAPYDDYCVEYNVYAIEEPTYRRIQRVRQVRLNAMRFGARGKDPARLPG